MRSLLWNGFVLAGLILGALAVVTLVERASEPHPFTVTQGSPSYRPIRAEIGGEVNLPGTYNLRWDARLEDLLDAAGGASPNADLSDLSLAAAVQDGQRVVVPSRDGDGAVAAIPLLVDINTASFEELDALPEIGPVRAQAIIDSRETDGWFLALEDLVLRDVLPLSVFEQIRSLITASR